MRLDNSEICILLKNFTKTKACDPGGYAAAAVEIIVHQGRSVVDTLVAIQIRSIQINSEVDQSIKCGEDSTKFFADCTDWHGH